MQETLYKKVGRKYVPVGIEFRGFPCNGIWLVQDGRQSCMVQLSEIPSLPEKGVIFRVNHLDKCVDHISEKARQQNSYSILQVAEWACDYFAEISTQQTLEEMKKND